MSPEEDRTRDAVDSEPKHYQLSYSGPQTSILVWQHVKLSEQIPPWDTLACCWGIKQATKKQTL